jgi:hypothetical protein
LTGLLDNYFRANRTNKQLWSLTQRYRSVDYAIAGSSRAFHGIDIATLERHTGRNAINLGYDGQSIVDMYLTCHLFIAHYNDARDLVLQLDGWDLDDTHRFLRYLYLPYTNDDQVSATLNEFQSKKHNLLTKLLPIVKYAEYNEFYTPTLLREGRSNRSLYDESSGSELLFDESYRAVPAVAQEPRFIVDERARQYLDRIVNLSKTRGIRLTVFSAPIYREPLFKNYINDFRAYIGSYCEDHSISYLDFTSEAFDLSEFRDYSHLNGRGALRFTRIIGDKLLQLDHKALSTEDAIF